MPEFIQLTENDLLVGENIYTLVLPVRNFIKMETEKGQMDELIMINSGIRILPSSLKAIFYASVYSEYN